MTQTYPKPAVEPPRPVVLLVDDNPDDRELARMAIASLQRPLDVVEAMDGLEALDLLRNRGADKRVSGPLPRPSLILLDVNMPRLDGKQFLRELRGDERYARLPVVMFTTSTAPWDVDESYAAGCNLYLVKPFAADELTRMLGDLFRLYLEFAELPSR
ncbi:response regulator [Phycisphaera mikurensis]|uniref:Putative response regulator receiver protein n=1 Tax=Phycisphaera mikurensis (strain NBRC 102666 / KCTC 22515 / FYK2301M01) TaxID=1142394 RepID=I0IG84_PHYMF|nr:response regulator [Phycisphaera mikurensis]MBB6440346.1 two-component system response regulator [Phycisphaera mikurensis]BAM04272.1 putative response regulator receiver protein [Phycisphaera mikurensis NBRC 102666]